MEASRIIKESWWLTDGKRSLGELHSAGGYALLDTTWPARDNTSTAIASHLVNSAAQVMFVNSTQRDTFTYHVGDNAVIASQDTERNVEIEEIRKRGEERCKGSEDRRSGDAEEKKNKEAMIFSKFDINSTTT
ncbi:hypothetical protein NC653_025149 [Populus alba x Populus x berolinensis]|uniref:Uncharacterized protein n=2 Tax=Populus TaxID=3689 RepID=A0A4V5ZYH3_POPAL|nr:hypothetical protein NC653_025149 [Populus alba x Populus x berolinensis]TKR63745.1 hypothetical protein D5086_0000321300 [Populus alba]